MQEIWLRVSSSDSWEIKSNYLRKKKPRYSCFLLFNVLFLFADKFMEVYNVQHHGQVRVPCKPPLLRILSPFTSHIVLWLSKLSWGWGLFSGPSALAVATARKRLVSLLPTIFNCQLFLRDGGMGGISYFPVCDGMSRGPISYRWATDALSPEDHR